MTPLEQALIRASTDVRQLGLHWALVGGFAVVIRAEPRLTRDIDIAFAVSSDAEAERVVQALRGFGYAVDQHLEQEANTRPSRSIGVLVPRSVNTGTLLS